MPQRPVEERDAVASGGAAARFRAATVDDVPALLAVINPAYRAQEGHVFPSTERVDRTDALRQIDDIIVATERDTIVGCVRLEIDGASAHFGLLATAIQRQGRGIGSALIEHAEDVARAAGCAVMRIEVVKEAGRVPFYERRGYRVTRETPGQVWNGGQDWGAEKPWHMTEMEKSLT